MGNLCSRRKKPPPVQSPSVQPEKLTIRIPKQRQTYSHSKTKSKSKSKNNKKMLKKSNTR